MIPADEEESKEPAAAEGKEGAKAPEGAKPAEGSAPHGEGEKAAEKPSPEHK